jgi:hypothetical protein
MPGFGQDSPQIAADIAGTDDSDFDLRVGCSALRAEQGAEREDRSDSLQKVATTEIARETHGPAHATYFH